MQKVTLKVAFLKDSLFLIQVQMEQHATARKSSVEGVCHAAVGKCKYQVMRFSTPKHIFIVGI